MNLWQLRVFCKVIELKSFSRAALAIHLSQPTVSSHIRDLENFFQCRLIDRMAKSAVPTPAGKLLYRYARKLIRMSQECETAIAEYNGTIRGELVVGGSTIPGGYLMPPLIGEFKAGHEDVTIRLVIRDTAQVLDDILAGHIELGIVGAEDDSRKLRQEKIFSDDMRVIVPANHRWAKRKQVTFQMICEEPYIAREVGSGTQRSVQDRLEQAGHHFSKLRVVGEMGNTVAVVQAVQAGMGISILSTVAVADAVAHGKIRALSLQGVDLTRHFYLTRHRHRTLSTLGRAFVAFVQERCAGDIPHGRP